MVVRVNTFFQKKNRFFLENFFIFFVDTSIPLDYCVIEHEGHLTTKQQQRNDKSRKSKTIHGDRSTWGNVHASCYEQIRRGVSRRS